MHIVVLESPLGSYDTQQYLTRVLQGAIIFQYIFLAKMLSKTLYFPWLAFTVTVWRPAFVLSEYIHVYTHVHVCACTCV